MRIVTLNLLRDLTRWDERKQMLLDEFERLQPDVIALQEVALPLNTAEWLAKRLSGYDVHLAPKSGRMGVREALARARRAGVKLFLFTNQSGVGRRLFDMATLNAIHEKMMRLVAQAGGRIDAVFFCPCAAEANCECRKPRAGMFREISERFGVVVVEDVRGQDVADVGALTVFVGDALCLFQQPVRRQWRVGSWQTELAQVVGIR